MTNDARRISLTDLRAQLAEIIAAAEHRGETTVIERYGRPVAMVAPAAGALTAAPGEGRRRRW